MDKTLQQAVEEEINNNLVPSGKDFSSHDVTTLIRDRINNGEYDITDCKQVVFGGKSTRYVSNDAVKAIVRSVCEQKTDYYKKWIPTMGSGYFAYCPKNNTNSQTPTPQHPNSNIVITATQTPQPPPPLTPAQVAQSIAIVNTSASNSLFASNDD